jgi:hypothetical protein
MNRKAVLERTLGKKAAKKYLPQEPKNEASSTVSLEIEADVIEQIVVQELVGLHTSLSRDLKDRKAGKKIGIFDMDKDIDIATLNGHLFAVETVLKYYTTPAQLKEYGFK